MGESHRTITIKGTGIRNEALANAELYPGHLVELMSTGKVKKHATAGGNVLGKFFAVEDDIQGNAISTAYAAGKMVQYDHFPPGTWVLAVAKSGAAAIVIGDPVESAGDGTLQKHTADAFDSVGGGTVYSNNIVGIARSAIDNSDSAADALADSRFLVEII